MQDPKISPPASGVLFPKPFWTLDEVKISGVCLRESGLGSEGVFCDLNLVDTQGRRRWTGTCPYGQSISTIVLPLMWNCLSCFLIL